MDINDIKQIRPYYRHLSDDQIVDQLRKHDYPDRTREEIAGAISAKLTPPPEPAAPERNIPGFINDQVINVANSALGIGKTISDFVDPDSAISHGIDGLIKEGEKKQSDKQKFLDSNLQQDLAQADGGWAKAGAYLKHAITADPSKTVAQAVGNFAPFMAVGKLAQAAKLGQTGQSMLSMGVGGVSGAGEVRGNIFEKINSMSDADLLAQSPEYFGLRVDQGLSEKDAKARIGADASRNTPELLAAGAMGALSGKFGVEAMASGVAPKMGRMASAGVGLLDEATQGGVEQVATNVGVQRALPGQSLVEDVPLNMAMEGLPGLLGGGLHGGHGPHAPQVADNNPLPTPGKDDTLTKAAHVAVALLPAPSIQVTPGDTAVTSDQRAELIRQGLEDKEGGIVDVTPIPQQPSAPVKTFQGPQEQIDQSLQNIKNWGQRADPVPLEQAQSYKAAFNDRGVDVTVIPHPVGQGFTVVPSQWVAPFMRSQAQQAPLSGMLPAPDMPAPDAPMVSDTGAVRPQTYGDQAASRATAESWKKEAERKASIGLTPDVEKAQRTRAMAIIQPGDITTPKGTPFPYPAAAMKAQKKTPGEIVQVRGGWVIRPAAQDAKVKDGNTGSASGMFDDTGTERAPDSGSGVDRLGGNTAVRGGAELQPDGNAAGGSGESADRTGVVDLGRTGGVVDGAVTEKRPLKKVADVYGSTHYVDARELASDTTMLKRYRQDGVPISTEGKTRLHRDNIDLDGSKAKNAWKDLPALDNSGKGFGNAEAVVRAIKRMKQDVGAFDIKQHDGSGRWHAVRKQPSIKGEAIDKDWAAFTPESGTLGIPRADMPQIKAEHRGAMVNFLNARGVEHEQDEVPARSLKPAQAEFSPEKVQKAKDFTGGDRSILVSEDGHVVDGHHQWLAKHDAGEHVKVIRLKAPIKEVLDHVREFPSAETQDGATKADDVDGTFQEQSVNGDVTENPQDSVVVRPGKGLINGKYIAEVDGDFVPDGPWDTEQQARLAGEKWKQATIERYKATAKERERWNSIADKFKSGQEVTATEIESIGLKPGLSDVRWFFPISAKLFGITSRDIRPIVKNLIREGRTDMGAKREFVPTRKGLEAVAADVLSSAPTTDVNSRDTFTVQRLDKATGSMEPVEFNRGEYVKVWISDTKSDFGEIDGVSQARREFSVNGLWHHMGAAYKAERPAAPVKKTEPLSKTIEKMNAKNGEGLTDADRVPEKKPASKTPNLDRHTDTIKAVREGKANVDEYRASFAAMTADPDAIKAELLTMSKESLLRAGGMYFYQRNKQDTKPEIAARMYDMLVNEYALGKDYGPTGYFMGQHNEHKRAKAEALRALVEGQTPETLADFAAEVAASVAEAEAEGAARKKAIENPQTLEDFRASITAKLREGKTRQEAYLSLTVEQRAKYDELEAESTREDREARKRAAKTEVRAAGQTTAGEIVATKHTRDGHDLWVVKLADRLSADDYRTVLASAKRLGGSYSSFRGNGAIPGFQFRTPEAAQAFLKLAGGDTSAAKDMAEQRRDSFEDDRSQSAVERLREMADKIDERAQEDLDRERKTNTARRARFAASADREAQQAKALAKTMRNIADAIEGGDAKFLDAVRTKTQVEMLRSQVATAKDTELRAKYPTYAEQEKRRGEPATAETADFAEFPMFTAFRSDLASLARQMLEVEGTKKMGQQLMSVADDVTDAYIEFAKKPENLHKLSTFSIRQGDDVKAAILPSKDAAEKAIRRSGLTGKAMVLVEKRGVNRIIMSPSEAMSRGVWTGDGDKRITLTGSSGAALVEAIGRRGNKTNRLSVPWQLQTAYDRRNALKRIGIETASEYRSALREFIGLQERAIVNKVREMELAMTGRKNDGLDFFPTPAEVADQMVAAADISPDMAVLEPSAGMGHIADRIREAGAEPDVIELAEDRRELLQEKGYNLADFRDFLDMKPRQFFTYGDVFRAPDGAEGVMSGSGGMGSNRVILKPLLPDGSIDTRRGEWYARDELVGIRHRGTESGYDRIIMNPPFSNGRDIQHVMHAYDLLKPGGRIVAIMGESAFFNQSKKAQDFRQWLDEKGGTSEKLAEGSFMDPSLPVTTGVNARMVVVDKPESDGGTGFSRDADQSEENALKALSENDDLFRLPKSDKTTVAEIATDNDPGISVKKLAGIPGRTEYQLTMQNGTTARLVVRPANPYGNNTYGFDYADGETSNVLDERPGDNPQDVDPEKEDVWIDVSLLKPGQDGAKVYNIAATYAHNTGRIFIGDPAGLSNEALRRRPEQMLSSALKFGTTEHLAPHPRQVTGDKSLGVPPLKWVYGDDVGNIRRLIDLNLASLENAGGNPITFNPATGEYLDSDGENLSRGGIKALAESGLGAAAGAGRATLERSAVLSSLLREEGSQAGAGDRRSNGLLGRIVELHSKHRSSTEGIFYSREGVKTPGDAERASAEHVALVKSLVDKITEKWKNAPEIVVLASFSDAPASVRRENERQLAGGASGEPGAFFYGGKAYLLASRMSTLKQVRKAVFHEVLGHLGMRGLYGSEMDAILDQLYKVRRSAIEKKALQYGLDLNEVRDRRMATEEHLADIAQSDPKLGFVRRALAAIRSWLRRNVPALAKMRMTDEELINEFILPVQQFVKEGPDGSGGKLSPAFMRSDSTDTDTSFSRTTAVHEYADQARTAAKDFFGNAGSRVDWLDKSLKTQYAKAEKFPAFGKVFNKVQDYIEGVSALANEAADKAPSILPKLDTFSDLWKNGILSHGLKTEDRKAVAAPVFDGTLEWSRVEGKLVRTDDLVEKAAKLTVDKKVRQMLRDGKVSQVEINNWMASKLDIYDAAVTNRYEREYLTPGVVFTDQELKDIYKLTPEQIGHYREFRASVDESLDQVAAAEIVRLVPNLPDDIVAMAQSPQGRAGLRDAVEGYLGDQNNDLWNQVQDKYLQTEKLKSRGYAPLSRFGKFFVHAVDEDGQTQYFGLAETRSQSNRLTRELKEEFGQSVQIEQGRISQEQYKLMAAVPLDAMEIFASAIGAEESEVFQKYLQLAKNNRSTMKRLIRRKGTSGYSDDVPRVLANFVTSNARAVSTNLHVKDAKEMAANIREGDIKDEAVKLIQAVTEPEESGAAIRSAMFVNFIGGSIASAMVNVTQPVMMTLPYLSQWGGFAQASKRLASAASMAMARNAGDSDLRAALKRAEQDGIVSPQEIHHLIKRAAGGLGERHPILQKMAFVWGAPFSLAEQFNRRTSFIAAFQTAREEGIADPFGFAEKAVIETQGLYNAGNKPNAARGIAGATAMTFKQYSIHYLEWLARMAKSGKEGRKAALLALALLALAAGADGLPFMGDLDDVFDTIGQSMGYDTNTKRWRHKMASDVLGDELGEIMTRGVSASAGMPFDVSGRMTMGNLIPATDLLMKSNTDTARSLAEFAGPGGGMFIQYRDAVKLVLNGDLFDGAKKVAPVAVQNLAKGISMAVTGEYRDTRESKVIDADLADSVSKMLGFQPADVARESSRLGDLHQSESLAKLTKSEISDMWARAIADGDKDGERKALDMRDNWNAKNPDMPIKVRRTDAVKKARQLRMDRADRFAKTVAPERRSAVKAELSN